WSPDGKRIAITSARSGERRIYIVDVDGGRVVDVGEGHRPAWSPDGNWILFDSPRDHTDNATGIYVMHPDGTDVRPLTPVNAAAAAWSPDGLHIIFSWGGLFVMRADGSCIEPLPLAGVGEATFPDWK